MSFTSGQVHVRYLLGALLVTQSEVERQLQKALAASGAAVTTVTGRRDMAPRLGIAPAPVESVLVEDPEPQGRYSVNGVGEPPTVLSTAANLSAFRAATSRALTRDLGRLNDIVKLWSSAAGGRCARRKSELAVELRWLNRQGVSSA